MSDRELLEKAAKAAGIEVERSRLDDPLNRDMQVKDSVRNPHQRSGPWNPLTDCGDALRLAVKLNIGVMSAQYTGRTCAWLYCKGHEGEFFEPHGNDMLAATRRAIVRAAASIGEKRT